jgi:16S rRNA G527 N7-methylase RsmG
MTRRVIKDPKLFEFMTLFEKWNQSINLSAARTRDELEHHIADCLNVVLISHRPRPFSTSDRVADFPS